MYQPEQGERVRVVLEGVVLSLGWAPTNFLLSGEMPGERNTIRPADSHVVSVEKLEGPEPPLGSVVRSVDGDVWARWGSGGMCWAMAGSEVDYRWDDLTGYGPLTVIYTPESE